MNFSPDNVCCNSKVLAVNEIDPSWYQVMLTLERRQKWTPIEMFENQGLHMCLMPREVFHSSFDVSFWVFQVKCHFIFSFQLMWCDAILFRRNMGPDTLPESRIKMKPLTANAGNWNHCEIDPSCWRSLATLETALSNHFREHQGCHLGFSARVVILQSSSSTTCHAIS